MLKPVRILAGGAAARASEEPFERNALLMLD